MRDSVALLIVLYEFFVFRRLDGPSDLDILKQESRSGVLCVFLKVFPGDVLQDLVDDGCSFLEVVGGEFVDHSHH